MPFDWLGIWLCTDAATARSILAMLRVAAFFWERW